MTAAGQQLYQFMNPFFRDFDKMAADLRCETTGKLKLAVSSYAANHYLPAVIAAFSPTYPEISLHVRICEPPEVVANVESGRAEIGICSPPRTPASLAVVRTRPIIVELLVPSAIARTQKFDHWEEVVRHPLILPEKTSSIRQSFDELVQRRRLEKLLKIKAELATPELSLEAVRAGLGIALTAKIADHLTNLDGVARIRAPKGLPNSYLEIFKDKTGYTPRYVDEFITTASNVIRRADRHMART